MHRFLLLLIIVVLNQIVSAHPAYGIVMDHQGNLYFTDIMHNGRGTLWKLDKNKKLTAVLKNFHAHNVNVDSGGNIYSAHGEDTHTLIRIAASGSIDTLIMTEDMTEFFGGSCTVSPDGQIYFGIDKKVWLWTPEGNRAINAQDLKWNQGFYVDENETIYATDIGRGAGGSLVEIRKDGTSHIIAEHLIDVGDRDFDPTSEVLLGVNKDEEGNLYVADLGGKRIAQITPEGIVKTHYQSGSDWNPSGIFINEGEEYILEIGNDGQGPRIIKKVGSTTEVYFDYATHHNHPQVFTRPGGMKIPWQLIAIFFPVLVYAIYQSRNKRSQGLTKAV
ncbi:MAG: hypothetical protein HKN68_08470 [Saprospiraceae bacterium]|nr:hypothetical protein [Saprospiraceae bacterium]